MPKLSELVEHKGRMRRTDCKGPIWLHWGDDQHLRYDNDMLCKFDKAMLTCDWEIEDVGVTITTRQYWNHADDIACDDRDTEMFDRLACKLELGPKP